MSCEGENDTDMKTANFIKAMGIIIIITTTKFKASEVLKYNRINL
jgi:hypothetical protein